MKTLAHLNTLTERAALDWLRREAALVPRDQACVELGVFRGGSLKHIIAGTQNGNHAPVYGVDAWNVNTLKSLYTGWPHLLLRRNHHIAADIAPGATLIEALTTDAAADWSGPTVGLLYIDADHRRRAVLRDFYAWRPHLSRNAVIAFDDYRPAMAGRGVATMMNAIGNGVAPALRRLVARGDIATPQLIGHRLAVTYLTR